jgi:hypothetical protein
VNTRRQVTIRQWFHLPKAVRKYRIAEFRAADAALQANSDREETEESNRLNDRVNDLWPTVPWWHRQ